VPRKPPVVMAWLSVASYRIGDDRFGMPKVRDVRVVIVQA
jgi:hypothetical protein